MLEPKKLDLESVDYNSHTPSDNKYFDKIDRKSSMFSDRKLSSLKKGDFVLSQSDNIEVLEGDEGVSGLKEVSN
eukprot:CAMPEP_0116913812 /NCGR_PEP_ID=MMETSP0467-20121206/16931_1 /TAXON_ID=283647 /ORGANISM="Mesodinium pulex, Strain SPMC105" /LENGTH=73 /DNA_ID=CAMNT_0004590107 /DNA_START=489 /DNA_END=710 /DNA_ORIENTATION=+